MKTAYILHGCCSPEDYFTDDFPSPSNAHWFPWLQRELLRGGYICQTPELTAPCDPDYGSWKKEFDIYPVDDETLLIGHSCAAGFFLRLLAETQQKIHRLVMVAPWLDPKRERCDFLEFDLDPALSGRITEMHILYSLDDPSPEVEESVAKIREVYPDCRYHEFKTYGHFCEGEMKTRVFPELLEIVLPEKERRKTRL